MQRDHVTAGEQGLLGRGQLHPGGRRTGGIEIRTPCTDLHPERLADLRHALTDLAQPQPSQPRTIQITTDRLLPWSVAA